MLEYIHYLDQRSLFGFATELFRPRRHVKTLQVGTTSCAAARSWRQRSLHGCLTGAHLGREEVLDALRAEDLAVRRSSSASARPQLAAKLEVMVPSLDIGE